MKYLKRLQPKTIASKLILTVTFTLFISLILWGWMNIEHQRQRAYNYNRKAGDYLTETIKMGAHYAMLHNLREDINYIINNLAKEKSIQNIRIFNKEGVIRYSSLESEIGDKMGIHASQCHVCHKYVPPAKEPELKERSRFWESKQGGRRMEVLSPIKNRTGCSSNSCHVHKPEEKLLGILGVVVSLEEMDEEIMWFQERVVLYALTIFILVSGLTAYVVVNFIREPIKKLVEGTEKIAEGEYDTRIQVDQNDELGQLGEAINQMKQVIGDKQAELNRQRDEYQTLFELVPCLITVQDRDYKLIQFNREFSEKFNPWPGDYCFHAYKNRKEKCKICPVEKTFEDGHSHYSEEMAINKDGKPAYWVVKTAPIKNQKGETVAAMEMSLDITRMRLLEDQLAQSEKQYSAIFDNIPNAVFVLDRETLEILDCNNSVKQIYEYEKEEITGESFMTLFHENEVDMYQEMIKTSGFISQVTNYKKNGERIYVTIRLSPLEYPSKKVLLVTISDITKRLEAEQQLIQASKMTTLGEMATGIAHELNQPLTVIKSASSFIMRKVRNQEEIDPEVLSKMAGKMDSHVDRATKIINHIRQFGRKSEVKLEKVKVDEALKKTMDILGQQLKVRGIPIEWNIGYDLPEIMGDTILLEQVFINLIINARDAIEEKREKAGEQEEDRITLEAGFNEEEVWIEVCDTGVGIPEPYLNRIFEPFFTTKKVGSGTGLGLSITYSIVKDCGGNIYAYSPDKDGACFRITFPVAEKKGQ